MRVLQERIAGMPLWAWGAVIVGGIALAIWVLPKFTGGGANTGTTGQTTAGGISDPNIDPLTGVPYAIEEAINPSTGLPAYYGAGAGGSITDNGTGGSVSTSAPPVQNNNPNPSGTGGLPVMPGPCGDAAPPPGFRCVNGRLQYVGPTGGGLHGSPVVLGPHSTSSAPLPTVRRI